MDSFWIVRPDEDDASSYSTKLCLSASTRNPRLNFKKKLIRVKTKASRGILKKRGTWKYCDVFWFQNWLYSDEIGYKTLIKGTKMFGKIASWGILAPSRGIYDKNILLCINFTKMWQKHYTLHSFLKNCDKSIRPILCILFLKLLTKIHYILHSFLQLW